MRRLTILMAMLTLASLVSTSQAGLFGWRTYWRRLQRPFYTITKIHVFPGGTGALGYSR